MLLCAHVGCRRQFNPPDPVREVFSLQQDLSPETLDYALIRQLFTIQLSRRRNTTRVTPLAAAPAVLLSMRAELKQVKVNGRVELGLHD